MCILKANKQTTTSFIHDVSRHSSDNSLHNMTIDEVLSVKYLQPLSYLPTYQQHAFIDSSHLSVSLCIQH